ncbi:MAG: VPA1262 family N-terminal domain-containing protein [Acidiferrobacterales bacterium]
MTLFRVIMLDDYQGAMLRLATLRAAGTQYLLFAWVELYPFDMTMPNDWNADDKPWTIPGTDGWTCSLSVKRVTVADAFDWYEAAAGGKIEIGPNRVAVRVVDLGAEPAYGTFCTPVDAPFAQRWHDNPRIHRLVPLTASPQPVRQLAGNEKARDWLDRNLGFDPFLYDEWLGGLALVAPDPLCSAVDVFPSARAEDGTETLTVRAVPRRSPGRGIADISGLSIHFAERRVDGWSSLRTVQLDRNGYITVVNPQVSNEIAFALICPERGLLRWTGPASRIEQIGVNIKVSNRRIRVEVPGGGRRKPAKTIEIQNYEKGGNVVVGEPVKEHVRLRLVALRQRRKEREQREAAPQRLFGIVGDRTQALIEKKRKDAEDFVSGLVASAQRRVIFVDPYFSYREARLFALRAWVHGITPRILTSVLALESKQEPRGCKPGDIFVSDLAGIAQSREVQPPKVRVMPGGEMPVIHDRYLIVDSAVWHCGPSFNELGIRLGVMVRLDNPISVRRAVNKVWCRSEPLDSYWKDYSASSSDES